MADPVPAGSDASAGAYRCTQCGYERATQSGGDSVDDPYPDRS
jgi:hypothetical protein